LCLINFSTIHCDYFSNIEIFVHSILSVTTMVFALASAECCFERCVKLYNIHQKMKNYHQEKKHKIRNITETPPLHNVIKNLKDTRENLIIGVFSSSVWFGTFAYGSYYYFNKLKSD
jgi:hypothetical protein